MKTKATKMYRCKIEANFEAKSKAEAKRIFLEWLDASYEFEMDVQAEPCLPGTNLIKGNAMKTESQAAQFWADNPNATAREYAAFLKGE